MEPSEVIFITLQPLLELMGKQEKRKEKRRKGKEKHKSECEWLNKTDQSGNNPIIP